MKIKTSLAQQNIELLKKAKKNTKVKLSVYSKTEIDLLNDIDKKHVKDNIYFFAKLLNFGLLIPTILIIGFCSNWELGKIEFLILLLLFIIGNGIHLVWYLATIFKFRNPNKIIFTATITDIWNLNGENHGMIIYFGSESVDISNHFPEDEIKTGDTVILHYFQKANKEKGSLIRVEKIKNGKN